MKPSVSDKPVGAAAPAVEGTIFSILLAISFSHLLNDTIQSLIPAIYPIVKDNFHLSFAQVGLITFTFQLAASLLQPFVGFYTDRKPQPFSLAMGMTFTLSGLVFLSFAGHFASVLISVGLIASARLFFTPKHRRWRIWPPAAEGDWHNLFFR